MSLLFRFPLGIDANFQLLSYITWYDTKSREYQGVLQRRRNAYDEALFSGSLQPFVYPFETLSVACLLLAVLFIPRVNVTPEYRTRLSLYAFIVIALLCASTIHRCRTIGFAGGYGIGLMCTWGIIASAYLLLFNDASKDFKRLEWRSTKKDEIPTETIKEANGSALSTGIRKKDPASRSINNRQIWGANGPAPASITETKSDETRSPYKLVWQGYPDAFWHRLDWTLDLITSFRGVHWNWRISTLPPVDLPPHDNSSALPTSPPSSLQALHLSAVRDFIIQYLFVDAVKTITLADPYFHGLVPISAPSAYPFLTSSPAAAHSLRLALSLTGVLAALSYIFSLSPLLYPLLPRTLTRAPLKESLLYQPFWSHPITSILDHGLPGMWGTAWHQMFRFGISEPSRWLLSFPGVAEFAPRKSLPARFISVATAFALSGAIHATASYTSFSLVPSQPLKGPWVFFLLQAAGVLGQGAACWYVSEKYCDLKTLPRWVRRVGNLIFVLGWMYVTGPLLADDFARCGIWLFEPVPVSVWRGLLGQGWWVWGGRWALLWDGRRRGAWWKSGLAFV